MNNISRNVFLSSLTSLTLLSSSIVLAEEMVTAPSFDGGITASIGTFYAVPSAQDNEYLTIEDDGKNFSHIDVFNAEADYDFGFDAALGYIFEGTANGIELAYRNLNTNDTSDPKDGTIFGEGSFENVQDELSYELNALDLMISQYMDIGTHMQMRFSGGLSYVELEEEQHITGTVSSFGMPIPGSTDFSGKQKSEYQGLGPRVGIDARYDFGEEMEGFGIVGGASAAYFLGETDLTTTQVRTTGGAMEPVSTSEVTEDLDNHAVTNLRANLGIDYVYFFDNESLSTLGLELGYLVDWYDDGVASLTSNTGGFFAEADAGTSRTRGGGSFSTTTSPVTFSGPYLNLKGAF